MAKEQRIKLQRILEGIFGASRTYYQPGPEDTLQYPCVVYGLDDVYTRHANNEKYLVKKTYQATLIDRSPDSEFFDPLLNLPYSSFDRHFKTSGLNHYVFTIHF